jgi:hypothetical protein
MIRFDYDNIDAEELIIEFKCPKCFRLSKTDSLEIPKIDFGNYTTIKNSFKHKCQCGVCYTIDIYNSLLYGYGIIQELSKDEKDIFVHQIPFFACNKETIFIDAISSCEKIRSIVNEIDNISIDNKNYIFCLLFSNAISILDAFIKIYTEPIILCNDDLIDKFSEVFTLSKRNGRNIKERIKDFYKQKSFQAVSNQRKLLEKVFNVNVKIDDRLERYLAIRNIIIHRNSISTEGDILKIDKTQLLHALGVIEEYIAQISRAIVDFEANIFVENKMRIIRK